MKSTDGMEEQDEKVEEEEEEEEEANDELAPLPDDDEEEGMLEHDLATDSPPASGSAVAVADNNNNNDGGGEEVEESLRGVLFGRSVRASYASLNIAVLDDDDDDDDQEAEAYHVLVRIQFLDHNIKELRSYFRRHCKLGDLLNLQGGLWQDVDDAVVNTEWKEPRFIVNVRSIEQAKAAIQLEQVRYWNMNKTQEWQNKYYRLQQQRKARDSAEEKQQKQKQQQQATKKNQGQSQEAHHHNAGGLAKRKQGEYIANFLINMISHKLKQQEQQQQEQQQTHQEDAHQSTTTKPPEDLDASAWATQELSSSNNHNLEEQRRAAVLRYLNQGSGVLDVAGGSGHVSMALGLASIQSTVVDPRENAGKLPGRDRKAWNRKLKTSAKKRKFDTDDTTGTRNDTSHHRTDDDDNTKDKDNASLLSHHPASIAMAELVSSTENTSSTLDRSPPHNNNNSDAMMADVQSAIHALPGTNSIRDTGAIQALPESVDLGASVHPLPMTTTASTTIVEPMSSIQLLPSSETTSQPWTRQERSQTRAAPVPDTIQVPSTVSLSATASEQSTRSNSTTMTNAAGTNTSASNNMYCQPVVRPYQTHRAWFGLPPKGVDNTFRNPDDANVPVVDVCDAQHPLLRDCRAIVSLHPDEATDAIVDTAVQLRVPFVIVPCCVFCRLFPHRRMPAMTSSSSSKAKETTEKGEGEQQQSGAMVSTYKDLLDYLQAKDPTIQRATLPFVGANTVLWSTFS